MLLNVNYAGILEASRGIQFQTNDFCLPQMPIFSETFEGMYKTEDCGNSRQPNGDLPLDDRD